MPPTVAVSLPPPSPLERCFPYADYDVTAQSIGAVLANLKWEVHFNQQISKWSAQRDDSDDETVSMHVRMYAWPTQTHREGGLVQIVQHCGERATFDKIFVALRDGCCILPSSL